MTTFLPTTRLDVLRGTAANAWGDDVDTDSSVAAGLPAAVTENQQRTYLPAEQRTGVVETYTVRLRPGADVREGDRLRDLATGAIYLVDSVSTPPAVIGLPDVRCTTRKVAATSTP